MLGKPVSLANSPVERQNEDVRVAPVQGSKYSLPIVTNPLYLLLVLHWERLCQGLHFPGGQCLEVLRATGGAGGSVFVGNIVSSESLKTQIPFPVSGFSLRSADVEA